MMNAAFFHGLPGPHPWHAAYARSVGAAFFPAYPEGEWTPRVIWYCRMVHHALRLAKQIDADVYISEGLQFVPLLLRRLRRSPRLVMIAGSETAYFLTVGRYGPLKGRLLARLFVSWDGYLCVGRMETELVRHISGKNARALEVPGFTVRERHESLRSIMPDLAGSRLVFIANGPGGWRTWYKGLDVLVAAVRQVAAYHPDITLDVLGEWTPEVVTRYASGHVRFHGKLADLVPPLRSSALYVHCGRGDAFPAAILEAMLAGLPALVSDLTGVKEAVEEVAPWLVVPCEPEAVADGIQRYLRLSPDEREVLSRRARKVASSYTEERALTRFREAFYELVGE